MDRTQMGSIAAAAAFALLSSGALISTATAAQDGGVKCAGVNRVAAGKSYPVRFEGKPDWKPGETRIVAFVQDESTGEVLQALRSCSPLRRRNQRGRPLQVIRIGTRNRAIL